MRRLGQLLSLLLLLNLTPAAWAEEVEATETEEVQTEEPTTVEPAPERAEGEGRVLVAATNAGLNPFIAVWIPNIVFLGIGLLLYRLAQK